MNTADGQLIATLERLLGAARMADSCCDAPDDRLYRAADETWWRRVGNRWVLDGPPPGWKKP